MRAECLCRKLNLSFKAGLGSRQVIWLQANIEGMEGRGRQVSDGAAIGMCEKRRQSNGTKHGGFSSFVGAGQKGVTGRCSAEGDRKRNRGGRRGDVDVIGILQMKERSGGRHPGDRIDGGMMEKREMYFQCTEVLEGQAKIGRMEKSLGDRMGKRKKRRKRTGSERNTKRRKTCMENVVACAEFHQMSPHGFHGHSHCGEMAIGPIGLYNALDDGDENNGELFKEGSGMERGRERGSGTSHRIRELAGEKRMEKRYIIGKCERDTEDIVEDKVGGEEGKEGQEKGEAGEEIDAEEGPEGEKEGECIKGLEKGTKKEKFPVRLSFQVRGGGQKGSDLFLNGREGRKMGGEFWEKGRIFL